METLREDMHPDRPVMERYGAGEADNQDERERTQFEEDNFFRLAEDRKDKQARKRKEFEMHGGGTYSMRSLAKISHVLPVVMYVLCHK
jgi:hypothetical protein